MSQEKFEVTKEWLEGNVKAGMSIVGIAERLTIAAGRKCSTAAVKALCKHFEIDLRKRTRSYFIPAGSLPELPVQAETPGGIVEEVKVTQEMKDNFPETFEDKNVGETIVVETVTDTATIDNFINSAQ